jgi:hypothetical protein
MPSNMKNRTNQLDTARSKGVLTCFQKRYYWSFVVVSLICFSSFKILAYFAPLLFILMLLPFISWKKIINLLILGCAILVAGLFYSLASRDFIWQNYFLAVLTYSSFIPLVVLEPKKVWGDLLLKKMLKFLLVVFVIEGILGVAQGVYGFAQNHTFEVDNGDIVQGTIYPHFMPERAYANPMFTINMVLLLTSGVLLALQYHKKNILKYLLVGVMSIIMASTVHALLIFVVAALIGLAIVWSAVGLRDRSSRRKICYWLMLVITVLGIASYFIGGNLKTLPGMIGAMGDSRTPKIAISRNILVDIPSEAPLARWLGLGPGQFISRAALIGSGYYIGGYNSGRTAPFIEPQTTITTERYLLPLMVKWAQIWSSSTLQPYCSLLSVVSECGLFGLGLVVFLLLRLILRVYQAVKRNKSLGLMATVFLCGLIFIFLLGIHDNYYEMPQAIFIGVLFLYAIYANIVHSPSDAK